MHTNKQTNYCLTLVELCTLIAISVTFDPHETWGGGGINRSHISGQFLVRVGQVFAPVVQGLPKIATQLFYCCNVILLQFILEGQNCEDVRAKALIRSNAIRFNAKY